MKQDISEIKPNFETGDVPTQQQFYNWIESCMNFNQVGTAVWNVGNHEYDVTLPEDNTFSSLINNPMWLKFDTTNPTDSPQLHDVGSGEIEEIYKNNLQQILAGELVADTYYLIIYDDDQSEFVIIGQIGSNSTLAQILANGNTTADGQTIDAENGGGQLDLRSGGDNVFALTSDNANYGEAWYYGDSSSTWLGYAGVNDLVLDVNRTQLRHFTALGELIISKVAGVGGVEGKLSLTDDRISLGMRDPSQGYSTNAETLFLPSNGVSVIVSPNTSNFSAGLSSRNATFNIDVLQSVAVGGINIKVKTDETAYVNQFAFNKGGAFETVIEHETTTVIDKKQTVQDKDGIIALTYDTANYTAVTTVPQLTGDVDNWNPTGLATSNLLRVDMNANNLEVSGLLRPSPIGAKQIISISNLNQSFSLKFLHNDASSLPANRFLLRDGADKSIKPNETAQFHYDNTLGRWLPFNRVG